VNKNKKKMLEEFRKLRPLYIEVGKQVRTLLLRYLKKEDYKYQHVSRRTKKTKSLSKKIDKPEFRKKKDVTQFDDLSGCRVIFYLSEDAERFKQVIYNNFSVVDFKQRYSPNGYNADHYIVRFKKDQPTPKEYKKLKDLKCEIQVTTVLFHAWSEMHHEVYKLQEDFKKFAPEQLESLQARFSSIMEEHLKPASYDFSVAYREIERLKNGIQTFSRDYFNGIINAASINDLFEALTSLKKDVQYFSQDKTPEGLNLIQILRDSIAKSAGYKEKPIETEWGELAGKTTTDIIDVSLQILSSLSYQFPTETLEFFADYVGRENKTIRDHAARAIKELTSYKLNILNNYGIGLQLFLLDYVEKWDDLKLRDKFFAVEIMCEAFLQTTAEDMAGDYNSVTLSSASLSPTDTLKDLRKRTIKLLQKLFNLARTSSEKDAIISALASASRTPMQTSYGDDMEKMILSDTEDIIDFFIQVLPGQDNAVKQQIEKQVFWFFRRRIENRISPKNIAQFRAILANDPEYQTYNTLIGFDSVCPEHWDSPEKWDGGQSVVKIRIQKLLDEVTEENIGLWVTRFKEYSPIRSNDGAYFMNLTEFLTLIGQQKPDLALKIIKDHGKDLGDVILFGLLKGLWSSPNKAEAKEILSGWSTDKNRTWLCVSIMVATSDFDLSSADNIFNNAVAGKDFSCLTKLLDAAFSSEPYTDPTRIAFFMKTVRQFKKDNNATWIRSIYCTTHFHLAFPVLSEADVDLILDSLVPLPNIAYDTHRILIPIVRIFPEKIVRFFEKRIAFDIADDEKDQSKRRRFQFKEYDAVPFNFFDLAPPMAEQGAGIVPLIFGWFSKEDWHYGWEASHLLHAVFPSMGADLEQQLLSLVETDEKENILTAIRVLNDKRGDVSIHNVAKAIIRKFPNNKEYKPKLILALQATGVTTGEYGMVEQYKQKIEQTKNWLQDENKDICNFTKAYHKLLEKQMIAEQKRADDDIEIRKRMYGEKKPKKKADKKAA
jgi:ppGpp synthetase/RelA/SpoT-type nucleotidyltranferase